MTSLDFGLKDKELAIHRINFMFGVKHRNDGKINSHKWFFQGVCKWIKPEYMLMLDIGTKPDNYSLVKLYTHMANQPRCGGCCGEIEVDLDTEQGPNDSYFVQAAQFYEYKLGHTPYKSCESFFGFTLVLPGAYSFFRWQAIKG